MTNNRLTNLEINTLKEVVKEIKSLASMENTDFNTDNEDVKKFINDKLKLWLQWFDSEAIIIENILNTNNN